MCKKVCVKQRSIQVSLAAKGLHELSNLHQVTPLHEHTECLSDAVITKTHVQVAGSCVTCVPYKSPQKHPELGHQPSGQFLPWYSVMKMTPLELPDFFLSHDGLSTSWQVRR